MDNANETKCSALALSLLKADLGYFDSKIPDAIEANLNDLLCIAQRALKEECRIELADDDVYDAQLQSMYAAWLYRNKATGAGKPPMLKDAIRNRQVRNATANEEGAT